MHREKIYSYNLMGFKKKVNTLMGIKENVTSLVPSLLIKLSQVLLRGRRPCLSQTTLNSLVLFYSFVLVLLVCSTIFSFTSITYCHVSQTSITVLGVHNSGCHNPIIGLNN